MLLNPSLSLSNPPSSKNPKSGPQRIRLDITWDKNKDQRNSLWVAFWSLPACYPGVPFLCQTPKQQDLTPAPTPGGMPSRSKQQLTFPSPFSPWNNPYPSTQIRFCSVLWSIFFFFFCPTFTCNHKKTKFTVVKWPSDPITNPKGKHTLWWVDWYFSVAAQPWLCCEAALLPFGFQCMTGAKQEQSPSLGAHWGTVLWHR